MLIRPEGFVAVRGDSLSGPVGRNDAARVFADHPDDAPTILRHGFVAGYLQSWKNPDPSFDPGQHRAQAGAEGVLGYFQQTGRADGYQPFTVPAGLTGGYGLGRGPDTAGITSQAVTWLHGRYLLQWSAQYTEPKPATSKVVSLAVSQNAAAPA